MEGLEKRRVLASFVVTTATDITDETDNVLSLREAITAANDTAAPDVITFDSAAFASATEIDLLFGELAITNPVRIEGPGSDQLTIDAQNASRVINITALSGDVTIAGVTLTGGRTFEDNVASGNGTETTHSGAGVRFVTDGTLTLRDSVISGNETAGVSAGGGGLFADRGVVNIANSIITGNATNGRSAFGGGVLATDTVIEITGSTLSDNSTSGPFSDGGGLYAGGGKLTVTETLISGNRTTSGQAYGGGIYVSGGGTTIQRSTIAGNSADGLGSVGGGLAMIGDVQLINSTVHDNSADGTNGSGGGIATIEGSLQALHSTVTGNHAAAGNGGGIVVMNDPTASLSLTNSIIAENTDSGPAPDFLAPVDAGQLVVLGSLVGDNTGTTLAESQTADSSGNIVGAPAPGSGLIDPMLGALGNNGGPTPTRAPLPGSPAIDSGDNSLSVDADNNPLTHDQRGIPFLRNSDGSGSAGTVDRGAVEIQPPPAVPIDWAPPAAILVGGELTGTQLNATAQVPGTFTYTPPSGTILDAGDAQVLMVQFTPDDTTNYANGNASVTIDVVPPLDFGDAPSSYATQRVDDGARHESGDLRLGDTIDFEADGQPSENADAEPEDDGVRQISPILALSDSATTASFEVNVSAAAKLDGWIDYDGNGVFDHATEHIGDGTSIDLVIRSNVVSVRVPSGALPGETFARFRVSTSGGLLPTGLAADGEVEDFAVTIVDGSTAQVVPVEFPSGTVTLAADADELTIRTGQTEIFRAASSSVARYELTGAVTSDVLVIDHSSGDPIPSGGMAYDGNDRVNTVRVVGDGSELDVSTGGNVSLARIEAIDLGIADAVNLVIDRAAIDAIDPDGGGLVVSGGQGDGIDFDDAAAWRIGEPLIVAGFFFTRIETTQRFVQTDLPIAWHNFVRPSDINNDGRVTAADALRVINELTLRRFSDRETDVMDDPTLHNPFPKVYFDHNGDGRASALDALRVINELSRQSPSGEGEGGLSQAASVPMIADSAIVADAFRSEPAGAFAGEPATDLASVSNDGPLQSPDTLRQRHSAPRLSFSLDVGHEWNPLNEIDAIDRLMADSDHLAMLDDSSSL